MQCKAEMSLSVFRVVKEYLLIVERKNKKLYRRNHTNCLLSVGAMPWPRFSKPFVVLRAQSTSYNQGIGWKNKEEELL